MLQIKILIVGICLLVLTGCSTTGRMEKLIVAPDEINIAHKHDATVRVDVIGGDRRFVGSESFNAALMESLEKVRIFSSATDNGSADYDLFVIILRSENSGLGGSYLMTSQWMLRNGNGKEIWSGIVTGRGSSSAFGGAARIRAASERASKDTIFNGIEMLAQLSL